MSGERAAAPAGAAPIPRAAHPLRSMAFSALRFASVLIGAGLLLRTASAEYVVSAPQGGSPQPESREPAAKPLARLSLPKPDFGQPAKAHERVAQAVPKRETTQTEAVARLSAPIVGTSSAKAPAAMMPAAEVKLEKDTGAVAAVLPAERPASEAPHIGATAAALPSPPRQQVAGAGLLSPVRIVSGRPSQAPATAAPAPAAAPVPVATPPVAQPVQIALAPPVMRPGPRTTVLTTDVRAEMRRPASAWDYAEALPAELSGRPAAAPRQAASVQPAVPPVQMAMPSTVQALQPKAAAARGAREAVVAAGRAKPLRQPEAPVAAPRKVAAATGASPAAAARVVRPGKEKNAPRVLALLDQPGPADRPRTVVALPISDQRRGRLAVLERTPSARLIADKRRYRLRGVRAPDPQQVPEDKAGTFSAVESPLGVSSEQRSDLGEAVLADASASEISLRDRIPLPAF
ncbi:hypothetical protein [Novosphingobium sp.]|uniref:hypothetical protein n=1 Tax=Novosphingobium sp. TaxID=1874826 RepID=UPI002601F565|nr:hypothetical protein [Novosphingobium sp.]